VEILAESAGNVELLSSLDAQDVFAGIPGLDFFHEGSVDQSGPMYSEKSVRQEFFGDGGDRLAKKEGGIRYPPKQNVIALGFHCHDLGGIDKYNFAIGLDGNFRRSCPWAFQLRKR
jgi:hypothetical protein